MGLSFFNLYRIIPDETYSFYNYSSGSFTTKKRPAANRRTLDTLKDLWGYLIAESNPDTFDSTPSLY